MTIDNDIAVQDVDYRALKAKLERDGQRLVWDDKSVRKPAKTLPGLVTDDTDAQTTGSWTSGALSPVCGLTYLHDGNNGKGEKTATFAVDHLRGENHTIDRRGRVSRIGSKGRYGRVAVGASSRRTSGSSRQFSLLLGLNRGFKSLSVSESLRE